MELLWHAEVFKIKMVMLIQLERVIQMVTSRIKMRENNHFNKKRTEKVIRIFIYYVRLVECDGWSLEPYIYITPLSPLEVYLIEKRTDPHRRQPSSHSIALSVPSEIVVT